MFFNLFFTWFINYMFHNKTKLHCFSATWVCCDMLNTLQVQSSRTDTHLGTCQISIKELFATTEND